MSARVLFVAGGTGGHVFPALAVAEQVRALEPEAWIHFVGGRRGIEGELVPKAGHSLTRLPAAGLRGLGVAGALRFVLAFSLGFLLSLAHLLRWRPDVVMSTGGYASAAPAAASAILRRPLWLQEQNSAPGSTNRTLARLAERVFVAFEEARAAMGAAERVDRVPNPVRQEIRVGGRQAPSAADYESFALSAERPTLLVFGGSRGAATLNRAVQEAWPRLLADSEWQVLVQTGREDLECTRAVVTRNHDDASRARVLPFLDDMAAAYRVADLVVCRAGALTLAELCTVGKASVLVPYPHATDDHQMHNARALERAGAAVCIADGDFDGERLATTVRELGGDPARLRSMGDAARAWGGDRDGAREIAQALIERAAARRRP